MCLSLAGCGDDEPAQRKAFVAFMQSRILDQKGLHVPTPTAEEKKSFGPYAAHYDVILDFQPSVRAILMRPGMSKRLNIAHNIPDLLAHRAEMRMMTAEMAKAAEDLKALLDATNAKKAALTQPADLQTVFTAAYQRTVTAPAAAVVSSTPSAIDTLNADLALADYIDAHRDKIQFSGPSLKPTDSKTTEELRALLETSRQKSEKSIADQRALEAAIGR